MNKFKMRFIFYTRITVPYQKITFKSTEKTIRKFFEKVARL